MVRLSAVPFTKNNSIDLPYVITIFPSDHTVFFLSIRFAYEFVLSIFWANSARVIPVSIYLTFTLNSILFFEHNEIPHLLRKSKKITNTSWLAYFSDYIWQKPHRSPLRLHFLTCTLKEISCVICISFFYNSWQQKFHISGNLL